MKAIYYLTLSLSICMLVFTACSENKQKNDNQENTERKERHLAAEASDEDEFSDEVKRLLAQKDMEIMAAYRKVDEQFDKLIEAKANLTKAEKYAEQLNKNSSEYSFAQQQAESAEKKFENMLDELNQKYYEINGLPIMGTDQESINLSRERIKLNIEMEILEKYKQLGKEQIIYEYTGVRSSDY